MREGWVSAMVGDGPEPVAGEASAERALEGLVETPDVADEEPAGPAPPPPADLTAAAFFDVDNTMVHGSSLVHFARGLAARKYFTYRDVMGFVYAQAKFQLTGRENSEDVAEGKQKALAFIEGRSTAELESSSARRSTTSSSPTRSGPAPATWPRCISTPASRCGSSPPRRTSWRPPSRGGSA